MANISKVKMPNNSTTYDIISKTGRGIARCETDSSSTSTAFVVTVSGITSLYDGIILCIKNTKVKSAANCTINLNGLGAKRIWLSQSNSYCSTHWDLNQTYLFVYDYTNERWELQQGRDTDSNTDTKVRQTLSTSNTNYPLLMSYADSSNTTTNIDNVSYRANAIYANPSTGNIQATKLNGVDIGNSPKFTDTTYTFDTGANNGQIKVTPSGGTAQNVSVKGLGSAAYKSITDTYSSTGTDATSGKAVAAALGTLDGTVSGTASASKTLTAFSQTDGKVSATFGNISITKSQVSDFPSLGTAAAKNYTSSVTSGSANLVTSGAVYTAIDNLPEPMVFKGSLGTGGTITALPVDGTATIGDTYKVITAGTYASQSAKVGDTFICDSKTSSANTWVLIPSGDEPSGTVTSVTIKATSPIAIDSSSAITTSGTRTLSHANSGVTAGTYRTVTVNATGHVTTGSNDISDGIIDQTGFSGHAWTGGDPTIHTALVAIENDLVSGAWTKFRISDEISLSNVYVTGLAYSSKYVEGSIYLSEKIDSAVTFGSCTLSGGKVAMYGANGQIYASSATYPSYSITGVREAGVITVKFTLSSNFNTNNNNKPAVIWFDSGAKLTLH